MHKYMREKTQMEKVSKLSILYIVSSTFAQNSHWCGGFHFIWGQYMLSREGTGAWHYFCRFLDMQNVQDLSFFVSPLNSIPLRLVFELQGRTRFHWKCSLLQGNRKSRWKGCCHILFGTGVVGIMCFHKHLIVEEYYYSSCISRRTYRNI